MQPKLVKVQESLQAVSYPTSGINGMCIGDVGVLVDLGLSTRQARVYLALLKIGEAKAKAIADFSLVNRQEIYRVLESLQQIGLVQRNVCIPTTFSPTPIVDTIRMLLKQKTAQLTAIRQKTKQLTKKLQNNSHIPTTLVEKPNLGTIFEADRGKKYRQAIQASCRNIDIITSWKRFKQLTTLLETQLESALQKGIIIRIATEKPPNQTVSDWISNTQTQRLNKKGYQQSLQLKTLPNAPAAAVTIFDNTQTAIAFYPNTSLTQGPDLWTTNPTLTTIAQTYFNTIWAETSRPQKQSLIK